MHIELDDDLVARVDELTGPRGRSTFVRSAVLAAVEQARRWAEIESAAGTVSDHGHEWDADPAARVREQRRADRRRAG